MKKEMPLPPKNQTLKFFWEFKEKYKNERLFKIRVRTITFFSIIVLFIVTSLIKGTAINEPITKLNEYSSVGNYSMKMTNSSYNSKSKLMIMNYQVENDDSTALPQFQFKSHPYNHQNNLHTKVYRTDEDQYTVIINGLDKNYRLLSMNVSYPEADDDDSEDNKTSYNVSSENVTNDDGLKELTVGDYTTLAVKKEVSRIKKNNKKKKAAIKNLNSSIANNNETIQNYRSHEKYEIQGDQEKTEEKIDSLKSDNQNAQQQIDILNNQIDKNNERNDVLDKELIDLQYNDFDFKKVITQNN